MFAAMQSSAPNSKEKQMSKLKKSIRKILGIKTEHEKQVAFLSQAVDRYHLEQLEREYFGY